MYHRKIVLHYILKSLICGYVFRFVLNFIFSNSDFRFVIALYILRFPVYRKLFIRFFQDKVFFGFVNYISVFFYYLYPNRMNNINGIRYKVKALTWIVVISYVK